MIISIQEDSLTHELMAAVTAQDPHSSSHTRSQNAGDGGHKVPLLAEDLL